MAGNYNFTIESGSDFTREFTFYTKDPLNPSAPKVIRDLTGYIPEIVFCKADCFGNCTDDTPAKTYTVDSGNLVMTPLEGKIKFHIPYNDTGKEDLPEMNYYWYLKMIPPVGDRRKFLEGLVAMTGEGCQ